jgi:3-dehydroquinate synthase
MQSSILFLHENLNCFEFLNSYSKIFIVVDENTEIHCLPILLKNFNKLNYTLIKIKAGEDFKNLNSCEIIWDNLLLNQVDRNSCLIALGGGVVCDITGFCASTILRGIDCVYIPTTLMAMADASIGGKCGVNFKNFKNQIGIFKLPVAIIIEPEFLNTQSQRHLNNGRVEMIKHCLLEDNNETKINGRISKMKDSESLYLEIKNSISFKNSIVSQDFNESKLRKILNFGHTVGHAIESLFLSQKKDALHGECVAIGMICESYISSQLFGWKPEMLQFVVKILLEYTNGHNFEKGDFVDILMNLKHDKKSKNQAIGFSLLSELGYPVVEIEVTESLIIKSLEFYSN